MILNKLTMPSRNSTDFCNSIRFVGRKVEWTLVYVSFGCRPTGILWTKFQLSTETITEMKLDKRNLLFIECLSINIHGRSNSLYNLLRKLLPRCLWKVYSLAFNWIVCRLHWIFIIKQANETIGNNNNNDNHREPKKQENM